MHDPLSWWPLGFAIGGLVGIVLKHVERTRGPEHAEAQEPRRDAGGRGAQVNGRRVGTGGPDRLAR